MSFRIRRYEKLSRRGRRSSHGRLKNLRSFVYGVFLVNTVLQLISNDRELSKDPESYLTGHLYGFKIFEDSFFQCRNAFRLYTFLDYIVLSLHELYSYRVMCLFCELALRLSEQVDKLQRAVFRSNERVFDDIAQVIQFCANLNSDFSELVAAWCLVFVMTIIGFMQTCIEAFQDESHTVAAQILANPNRLLVSLWFFFFTHIVKNPSQKSSVLRLILNDINEKTCPEIKEEVLYLKLMYRLCNEKQFTLKLWQALPFNDRFMAGAFPNILMFGVTLHQVSYSKS